MSKPTAENDPAGDLDVARLQAERDELYDRLARVTADFQNARRRLEADVDARVLHAQSQLIRALLPVIDDFERALAVDPARTDAASILKGLQVVHDQWIAVLRKQNVDLLQPPAGTAFDPAHHEALLQQPSGEYAEPTVLQTVRTGYSLFGRTLRPAQVIVSRPDGAAPPTPGEPSEPDPGA